MTLTRTRNVAVLVAVATTFALSVQIIQLVDSGEDSAWHWFGVAVFAVLMGAAVVSIVKALRAIRAFETRNGRDAGRQRAVGGR